MYGSVRRWYTSSNSVSFAASIPQPNNGIVTLSLNAATTAGLSYGRYVYDVNAIDQSNTVTRLIEGILTVTPAVNQLANVTYGGYY